MKLLVQFSGSVLRGNMAEILRIAIAAFLLGGVLEVHADQEAIVSYGAATKRAYGLYFGAAASEATDIYCGIRFKVTSEDSGRPTDWLSLEHAYPADWMADVFGCNSREDCRVQSNAKNRARFNHAEGDLHNLWPALTNLNSSRGKRPFGEIPGDDPKEVVVNGKKFKCDFENDGSVVEPRKIVKGNLARSIFYMCKEYGFPVDAEMLKTLRKWNKEDPPSPFERMRNAKIALIQKTKNPFVDKPQLANTLACKVP